MGLREENGEERGGQRAVSSRGVGRSRRVSVVAAGEIAGAGKPSRVAERSAGFNPRDAPRRVLIVAVALSHRWGARLERRKTVARAGWEPRGGGPRRALQSHCQKWVANWLDYARRPECVRSFQSPARPFRTTWISRSILLDPGTRGRRLDARSSREASGTRRRTTWRGARAATMSPPRLGVRRGEIPRRGDARGRAPPRSPPDPHSAAAEAYVTTNGAGKDDGTVAVSVASTTDETSSVKLVRMRLLDPAASFTFRPGQWVDFWAPGIPKPGGYSVASSPGQIRRDGTFDLLVKTSRSSACGQWIYGRCAPGDEARVRVGRSLLRLRGGSPRAPPVGRRGHRHQPPVRAPPHARRGTPRAGRSRRRRRSAAARCARSSCAAVKTSPEQPMVSRVRSLVAESRGAVRCVFHVTGDAAAATSPRRTREQPRTWSLDEAASTPPRSNAP